jgi:DNA gyrase, A subunit
MANKKTDKKKVDYDLNIENVNIAELVEHDMKIYAANINLARAIPMISDGLKPVERRSIYSAFENGYTHKNKKTKLYKLVANTMGDYHPHGDASIADTMVRMGQPWTYAYPFIDGQGNYGSPLGHPAGAARYIEGRLSFFAYKCFFEDFDINILDTVRNYLDTKPEPLLLPARYPNILFNNSFGIGIGISSDIPNFNFNEVMELVIKRLEGHEFDYKKDFLYPDLPTGADIIDEGQFREICATGTGKFSARSTIEIDEEHHMLNIKNFPVRCQDWQTIMEKKITPLSEKNIIMGIKDIHDDSKITTSGDKGVRGEVDIKIFFRPEVDIYDMHHKLLKYTGLQDSYPVRFNLIDNYKVTMYNLYDIIDHWIEFRKSILRRYLNNKLMKIFERIHILEVLLFIFNEDNAEKTLRLIKKASNKAEVIDMLMKEYKIDSLKAKTIADMRMYNFSKDSIVNFREEMTKLDKLKSETIEFLDGDNISQIIIDQLKEGMELFGRPRKSKIIKAKDQGRVIKDTEHLLVFTRNNTVKKLPHDIHKIGTIDSGDYPSFIEYHNNKDLLLLFDEFGKVYPLNVYDIQNSLLNKSGSKLTDYINIGCNLISVNGCPEEEDDYYVLIVTKYGLMKKSELSSYNKTQQSNAINLNDYDRLVEAKIVNDSHNILVYGVHGYGLKFNMSEIPTTGRNTKGVKITKSDELILGFDIIEPNDKYILVVTEKGYVKKSSLSTIPDYGRNIEPYILTKLHTDDRIVKILTCSDEDIINVFQSSGITKIAVKDLDESTRIAKGRKLIHVTMTNGIIDVRKNIEE